MPSNPTRLLLALLVLGSGRPVAAVTQQTDTLLPGCAPSELRQSADLLDETEDRLRVAELSGGPAYEAAFLRRATTDDDLVLCPRNLAAASARIDASSKLSVRSLPLELRMLRNTGYPDDRNNGVIWAGTGYSFALSRGLELRFGRVTAALAPVIAFQENDSIILPGDNTVRYQFHGSRRGLPAIDWPLRMGFTSGYDIDWGQSRIHLDLGSVTFGLSHENLWWGPGIKNSILLSTTAGGFPHVFVRTSRPVQTPIGAMQAEVLWGRLAESRPVPSYDSDPANDERLLAGLFLGYRPKWLPELSLGLGRVYYRYWPDDEFDLDALWPFYRSFDNRLMGPADSLVSDTLGEFFSLTARWALPRNGFEVYAEWALSEPPRSLDELVERPDHSQLYTIGFQKLFGSDAPWLRLLGELSYLGRSMVRLDEPPPSYSTHLFVSHGYTHRGQLLGAWPGPGANVQYLGLTLFDAWGEAEVYGERIIRDNDAYFQVVPPETWPPEHDLELGAGVRFLRYFGSVDAGLDLRYGHRQNRLFFLGDDQNVTIEAVLRVRPAVTSPQRKPAAAGGG